MNKWFRHINLHIALLPIVNSKRQYYDSMPFYGCDPYWRWSSFVLSKACYCSSENRAGWFLIMSSTSALHFGYVFAVIWSSQKDATIDFGKPANHIYLAKPFCKKLSCWLVETYTSHNYLPVATWNFSYTCTFLTVAMRMCRQSLLSEKWLWSRLWFLLTLAGFLRKGGAIWYLFGGGGGLSKSFLPIFGKKSFFLVSDLLQFLRNVVIC